MDLCSANQAGKANAGQNFVGTPDVGKTHHFLSLVFYIQLLAALSGDFFIVKQDIEGINAEDLAYGTAAAKTATLLFSAYSSQTGEYSGSLRNAANTRSFVFPFLITATNTWQRFAIVVPGDIAGTWTTSIRSTFQVLFSISI